MIEIGHGGLPHPVHDARFYEGVPLRRLVAFVIDTVASLALGALAGTVLGLVTFGFGFALFGLVIALTGFAWRALSLARWSATPGMLAVGIEMRRRDGEPFGPLEAVSHTLMFLLMFSFVVPQVANIVAMATLPLGRGLHDLALGSAAIHRPA